MNFAIIFPGQGSQSLKMMDNFLSCAEIQNTFGVAKDVLGVDFLSMLQADNVEDINNTVNTQPLILTASYALYKNYLNQGGPFPTIMAGHSLGEWTALVASGVVEFTDALKLVKIRALAMQEAVPAGSGAMAAVIGLNDDKIEDVCNKVSQELNLVVAGVNFNSPGQVVIAGDRAAIEHATVALKEAGAKMVKLLPVSVPSHCSLMQSAADKLQAAMQNITFNSPQIQVLHNFNTESYTDSDKIKDALVKQLCMPVLWTKTIEKIMSLDNKVIIEAGPNSVLTGLNKRINADLINFNLSKDDINTIKENIK